MGNHLLTVGGSRITRRTVVMAGGIGISVLLSLAPAAFAETYGDPLGILGVGTNGSSSDPSATEGTPFVGISVGGCGVGDVGVAIGDPGQDCPSDSEIAVGLLGAKSRGREASLSDTGTADSCEDGCWPGNVAVSATGDASTNKAHFYTLVISGTGDASGSYITASGTENADSCTGYSDGFIALSGTGDTCGGIAISGTGNASGSTLGVSVLGTVTELLP